MYRRKDKMKGTFITMQAIIVHSFDKRGLVWDRKKRVLWILNCFLSLDCLSTYYSSERFMNNIKIVLCVICMYVILFMTYIIEIESRGVDSVRMKIHFVFLLF